MNRDFLNHFWDLASDDDGNRLKASEGIIAYLRLSENATTDLDYVCKRLVRGLSSSRSHARTGFSTCLTELIAAEFISIDVIISHIDETTKVTGSLKRGEERDCMLGKLFGALVIMKSQKRLTNTKHIEYLITTFLQLHSWKAWMREIVAECILFLISVISCEDVTNVLLPRVEDLLKCPLDDLAAWQIVLLTGLESYSKSEPQARTRIKQVLPSESIVSSKTLNSLKDTLVAATHGYPKIHRVWSSILGSIFCDYKSFVMDTPTKNIRANELKRHEEEILISFTDFIDKNLIVNSNEKRCVGYHLLVEMVQHCPVKSLRICISKRVVRSLVSARINKKHTLHIIAETTLKSLVLAAKDDNKARLILASCLVQYGGANFDQKSKTPTVQNLLEGLDEGDVLSHVKQLCELIGTSIGSQQSESPLQSSAQIHTANEQSEIEDEPDTFNTAQSVIDAMVSLSKNSNILGRYNVVVFTSLILLRLAYFSNCVSMKGLLQGNNSKSNKKENKKEKSSIGASTNKTITQLALQVFGDSSDHDACSTITEAFECLDLVNGSDSLNSVFTEDIASYAATKFLSILSDSGHKNYFQLSNMPSKSDSSIKGSTDNSLLQVITNSMALMISSGCKLRADSGLNGEDTTFDSAIKSALEYQKQLKSVGVTNLPKKLSEKDVAKYLLLSDSLISFISHAIFSVLSSDNGEIEALEDLGRVCIELVQNQHGLTKNEDSDDDDDDNENPQMKMFELTMDFLSAPEDQSIRGIREVIKKVWINIASVFPIIDEVIDSVVSVITNDNDDGDENENESMQDDEEDEDEAELDDHDDDDNNDANEMNTSDDEEVNKEIIVHKDSMFDLLDSEDDLENVDDMEGMLMHEGTPEQDSALAQLIELRKKSRKLGLLSAQKHQFLIRTRAVDILDILANHLSIDRLLLMIPPFIRTLKSVYASSTLMNMQECLSFCAKLKGLIEEKICKGKHHKKKDKEGNILTETSDNKSIAVFELSNGEVTKILEEIFICIKSSIAPLKHVASGCLFRLCRVVLFEHLSEMADVVDTLNLKTVEMLDDFKNKKNSKVSRKFFEELFSRFPDFAISCLLKSFIDGCSESKSIYIQTECCDILTSVLNRFKSLSSISQQLIVQQSAQNLISITKTTEKLYEQAKQDTTISAVCGKRLKTFLLCGKVVLQNMKMNSTNHTLDKSIMKAIQLFAATVNDLSQMVQNESINKKTSNSNVLASLTSITKIVIQLIADLNLSKSTHLESSSKKRIKQTANENTDEKRRKNK